MNIHEITLDFFEQFLNKSDKETIPRPSHTFEKIIEVQRTFLGIWRDARDYKKFKKMLNQKVFNIEKYCILAIGQKDEHAEMRMLGFLLNQDKILVLSETQSKLVMEDPIYFGISKLCCPYCNATLNVFNKLLLSTHETEVLASHNVNAIVLQIGDKDQDDDEVISSEHLSEKAVSALIQMSRENTLNSILEVRGSHDLRFKWTFPAFARYIDEDQKWNCKKVEKVKEVSVESAKVKPNMVYYEETKKDFRCVIMQNTSITKEGRKNVFKINPCLIEFSLPKEKISGNAVDADSVVSACMPYYCPGYQSKLLSVSILPGEEKIIEVWIDLETKLSEKANLSYLHKAEFNKKLIAAYDTVNTRVVDVSVPIKMVPSASTSSAEEIVSIVKSTKIRDVFNEETSLVPEDKLDDSHEGQLAEESSGRSSLHSEGSPELIAGSSHSESGDDVRDNQAKNY